MTRKLSSTLFLLALFCCSIVVPAYTQTFETHLAQAQQTLNEITRLLNEIQSHQGSMSPAEGVHSAPLAPGESKLLFDGKSLAGWKRTDFFGGGKVHIEPNFRGGTTAIVVDAGSSLSGITWTSDVPKTNYEISLETMKIDGDDFMCGLTFPVGDSHASLILGGWGGTMVGISSINNLDASENETSKVLIFPKDRWFAVRMRVTPDKLEAWLDDKKIVDVSIAGKKIGLRFGEIDKSVPLGLATYRTKAAYRGIKLQRLDTK